MRISNIKDIRSLIFKIKSEVDRPRCCHGLPLILFLCFSLLSANAEEPTDTISQWLDGVEVVGTQKKPLGQGGSMNISKESLLTGARTFGEADALKMISRQSGITTAGDYGSGLIIDGNHPSHILYRIDGVPVFFPYRFGGLFSTFNTNHFSFVDFERGIHRASMPPRLGAKVDFNTSDEIPSAFSGSVNIGMMASSLSFQLPFREKFSVAFSGRISYLNLFYGWLLNSKDTGVKYDFADLNLTLKYAPDYSSLLKLNLFGNNDRIYYDDSNFAMDTRMNWRNGLVSLSYQRFGDVDMDFSGYSTYFGNTLLFSMPQFGIEAPSSINATGTIGRFKDITLSKGFSIDAGYEFNYYTVKPQDVKLTGLVERTDNSAERRHPLEGRVYGDGRLNFSGGRRLDVGLSVALFGAENNYIKVAVDPRITFSLPIKFGSLNFHGGRYTQFLHQVGYSQIGLASDFWLSSNPGLNPAVSYNFEVDYSGFIPAPGLFFSADVYFKRLLNHAEMMGEFLSIMDADYAVEDYLYRSNGYAVGFNLMARREVGRLTGTFGVGYGLARNKFDKLPGYKRSRTEPGFTLNAQLDYRIDSHWDVGASFRYATGRPYTPIKNLYIIGGYVMKEYGEPNSASLPAWHRLDLSATWSTYSMVGNRRLRHLVNFSFINAYGRRNPEFITYVIDIKKGVVKRKQVVSLYRFFPSVSYTLNF